MDFKIPESLSVLQAGSGMTGSLCIYSKLEEDYFVEQAFIMVKAGKEDTPCFPD